MGRLVLGVAGLFFLGFFNLAYGANWTVSPSSDNDCSDNDCALQSVLNIAASNFDHDTIIIAEGEYDASVTTFIYEPGEPENFSLTLQGAGIGKTIIDAHDLTQVFSILPFAIPDDSNAHISVSGITFRNGNTNLPGGGLRIETNFSNIQVESCSFENNQSSTVEGVAGAGLFASSHQGGSVSVTNSLFSNNFSSPSSGAGASIHSQLGSVTVEGNAFLNNDAGDAQGTTGAVGGGAVILGVSGETFVDQNVFLGNFAEAGGAGFFLVVESGSTFARNNIIAKNSSIGATNPDSLPSGGAGVKALLIVGSLTMTNNTITDNQDLGSGGGLLVIPIFDAASASIYNSIIWGNSASGGFCSSSTCNDVAVADHLDFDGTQAGASFTINHSDYADIYFGCQVGLGCTPNQTVGADNKINEDPLFVNEAQNDYHLSGSSTLIDMGDSEALGLPTVDYDGRPRIAGLEPDMGAFEWTADALPPESSCLNGLDDDSDGQVDCSDSDCAGNDVCPSEPEPTSEDCENGVDDDGDGLADCIDPNCLEFCFGGFLEVCSNEIDDDEDGATDCEDSDCHFFPACLDGGQPFPIPGEECETLFDCLNPSCWDVCLGAIPDAPAFDPPSCVPSTDENAPASSAIYILAPVLLALRLRRKKK